MSAQRIRQPRVAELVASRLRDDILTGRLKEGDVLPTQESLFAEFGVSPPAVREAVHILEADGLISVRRGNVGGAVVHLPSAERTAHMISMVLQTRDSTPAERLVNQAGNEVVLTVRGAASDSSPRTVTVKALSDERPARYRDWVDANRQKVHQATEGRVGYIHVPDMGAEGYAEFHRSFLAEYDRDALIVDVRVNGGGHVSGLLLEKLARRRVGYDFPRWAAPKPGTRTTSGMWVLVYQSLNLSSSPSTQLLRTMKTCLAPIASLPGAAAPRRDYSRAVGTAALPGTGGPLPLPVTRGRTASARSRPSEHPATTALALQQAELRLRHDEVQEPGHRAERAVAVLHDRPLGRVHLEAHGAAVTTAAMDHSTVAPESFTSFTQNFASSSRNDR